MIVLAASGSALFTADVGAWKMGLPCKTKIEKAWIMTSVIIMVAHKLLESSTPDYDASAEPLRLWLELAMIVLSFPLGGLTMFALHATLFWCGDCRNMEFLFDWSTLLIAGYIQWFWVLPEFLRNRNLTVLDLRRPSLTPAANASPPAAEAPPAPLSAAPPEATEAAPPGTQNAAPLPAFAADAFAPTLAQFDAAGLTALDRILQASPRPSAPASPFRGETIFPRVS